MRKLSLCYIMCFTLISARNCSAFVLEHLWEIRRGFNIFADTFQQTISEKVLKYLSKDCVAQINEIGNAARENEKPLWLWQMLDATAKLESGILNGNMYSFGSFDECLAVTNNNSTIPIKGQYCLGSINLNNILHVLPENIAPPLIWALCAPDKCNKSDLNILTNLHTKLTTIDFSNSICTTLEAEKIVLDIGDIAYITTGCLLFCAIVLSTAYEFYYRRIEKDPKYPMLKCFSVITNGRKLFASKKNPDQLDCLSGIRTLSMMWIIMAHYFLFSFAGPVTNFATVLDIFNNGWTMYFRGATVSVDTFFMLGGIVMIYVFMKTNVKFNLPVFYIHRYVRLIPALGAVVFFHLTLRKHFGSSPMWLLHRELVGDPCKEYWWSALLFVQNIVNPSRICVGQSWYLSTDTQMYFTAPLFLIPLKKWKKLTLSMLALAACLSISCGFAIAYIYELQDINRLDIMSIQHQIDYYKNFYMQPHTRAAPWFIGCIIGYFIYEYKVLKTKKFRINWIANLILWACSLAVLTTCIFLDLSQNKYDRLGMSLYLSFVRPLWALALGWIIFSCVMGYGGIINSFLSLPVFQVLARLTYCMFVTHLTVILVISLRSKDRRNVTLTDDSYQFWSIYMIVVFLSIIWTLALESPLIVLEKALLEKYGIFLDDPVSTNKSIDENKNPLKLTDPEIDSKTNGL